MKRILRIVCIVLTLLWIGFIFSNSMDNGTASSEKSGTVHRVVNEIMHHIGMEQEISESTIRTFGHFGEFFVLGLLLTLVAVVFLSLSPKETLSYRHLFALLSVPCCTLVAMIDEWIQTFSPGRAAEWKDVATDTLGGLCALACFGGVFLILRVCFRARRS